MDIIDFHTHFFPPELAPRAIKALIENAAPTIAMKNYTDGTVGGLMESMRRAGIDTSVTLGVATKPTQTSTINRGCAENQYPGIVQFGTLHPDMENSDIETEIDYLIGKGIKGIKLHPEYQYFYIDNPKHFFMYEKLSSSGLITVFHSGFDPGPFSNDHALPPAIRTVHKNFPALKIVAAHMGGWMIWDDVFDILAGADIFFDTSAIYRLLPPENFVKLCRKHGCERILFGSDAPWYDQKGSVEWMMESGLGDKELEMIFYGNAVGLLGL